MQVKNALISRVVMWKLGFKIRFYSNFEMQFILTYTCIRVGDKLGPNNSRQAIFVSILDICHVLRTSMV